MVFWMDGNKKMVFQAHLNDPGVKAIGRHGGDMSANL